MKEKKFWIGLSMLIIFGVLLFSMAGCQNRQLKDRAMSVARSTVNYGLPESEHFTITGVSMPDSIMGDRFIDDEEVNVLLGLLGDVSRKIVARTDYLSRMDSTDRYLVGLANLQVEANNNMRMLIAEPSFTNVFTGWKVRVFYERVIGPDTLRVMRYCYLTPAGDAVIRTLDFPML